MDYYLTSLKRQKREEIMSYVSESLKLLGLVIGFGLITLSLIGLFA